MLSLRVSMPAPCFCTIIWDRIIAGLALNSGGPKAIVTRLARRSRSRSVAGNLFVGLRVVAVISPHKTSAWLSVQATTPRPSSTPKSAGPAERYSASQGLNGSDITKSWSPPPTRTDTQARLQRVILRTLIEQTKPGHEQDDY